MNEKYKISVIIPVYNSEKYLKECLDSIIQQTINPIEIICIDDGSTDDSERIITSYKEQYDNIEIIKQSNKGSGPARNLGIEFSHGKYICFMDADDYYPNENVLKQLYDAAEENRAKVCGGNRAFFKEKNKIELLQETVFVERKFIRHKDFQDCYGHCRYIFDGEIIRNGDYRYPSLKRFQDPPFLLNVLSSIKDIYVIPDVVYMHRVAHKEIAFNEKTVCDCLEGYRQCLEIIERNDYRNIYDRVLRYFLDGIFVHFYKYAYLGNGIVWRLLEEIYNIRRRISSDEREWNKDNLTAYIDSCIKEKNEFIDLLKNRNIIIYGAGKCYKDMMEIIKGYTHNIKGIVVSDILSSVKENNNIDVKKIDCFIQLKETITVIIMVYDQEKKNQIESILRELGFNNIYWFNYKNIRLVMDFNILNSKRDD